MAVFETILKSDLSRPVQVTPLIGNFFSSDNEGNRINVDVYDHGSPATLTGGVMGYIIRADNVTVTVQGTASGNRASILLPASAYTVVGLISIVIKNGETTIGACTSYVYRTTTDTIFDPGHVIPSIDELLAKISDCEAATDAAYDAAEAADAAVGQADLAVLAATSAVALADQAVLATSSAVAAADLATAYANSAAAMIDGLTVVASTVIPSGSATATVSTVSGHKHIAFGIPKGNPGKDFRIAKTFESIEEMEEYTGQDIEAYDFVMIDTGSVEDPDTGKLYCYEPESSPVWHYIGDLSGKQGIKGETGNGIDSVELNDDYTLSIYFTDSTSVTTPSIRGESGAVPSFSIGSVSTGAAGSSASATITGTDVAPVLNMVIPRGDRGDTGESVYYGTCSTAAATQQKEVTIANFPSSLATGQKIIVAFTYAQGYDGTPSLKVNNLNALPIRRVYNTDAELYEWANRSVILFANTGNYWVMEDAGHATTNYWGKTKLNNTLTSTATDLALTAAQGKVLNDSMVHKSGAETVSGVKTFSSEPIFSTASTNGEINFGTTSASNYSGTIGYSGATSSSGEYLQGRFRFYQRSPKADGSDHTGFYETYQLPKVDEGLQSSPSAYDIITTKDGTFKPIYKKEVTGTTTANGNLNLSVAHGTYTCIGAICTSSNIICLPYRYNNTNWGVHCCSAYAGMDDTVNTSVTVIAYFMPIASVPNVT